MFPSQIATDFNNIFLSYFSLFASFFSATSFININCHVHNGLRVSLSFGTITFRSFYYRHRHFGKIFIRSLFGELVMRCCTVRIVSHTHREKNIFYYSSPLRCFWATIGVCNANSTARALFPLLQCAALLLYSLWSHLHECSQVFETGLWMACKNSSTPFPLDSILLQSIYSRSINSNCTHAPLSTAQIYELKLLLSATYAAHRKIVKKNLSPEHTFFPS